jgi:calcium-binding protein CML
VFDRLKAIHAKCDVNGDGKISSDELTSAMAELMNEGRESTKPDFATWILSISEVDEAGEAKGSGLDVKQFIVMCAIGFILAEESKEMLASVDDAYRRAMMDVATAYLSFDREGKGYFTADEFQLVISASERSEATRNVFSDERFAELDVSGDGRVDFEEFVNAFSKWVSDEDEEEDEEDPYLSHKADPHLSRQANLLTPSVLLALLKPNWRRRMRRVSTSRE